MGTTKSETKRLEGREAPVGSLIIRADIPLRVASADLAVADTMAPPLCVSLTGIGQMLTQGAPARECRTRRVVAFRARRSASLGLD